MLNNLTLKKNIRSPSVCPENFTGENGGGGRSVDGAALNAARELGLTGDGADTAGPGK